MKKYLLISFVFFFLIGVGVLTQSHRIKNYVISQITKDFSKEKLSTEFVSYMTQVEGVQRVQVAKLDQREVLTKKSRKLIFWNKLELPPVVVALEVPVQYTYYVDLKKEWLIQQEGKQVEVVAPPLEFDRPAADVSAIEFRLQKQSLFRNEEKIKSSLLKDLTPYLEARAEEQKSLVKETARKEIQQLVAQWFKEDPSDELNIIIIFSDEVEAEKLEP